MIKKIDINADWIFHSKWENTLTKSIKKGESVNIPHNMVSVPMHYFDEKSTWIIGGYQYNLKYDKSFENKRVFIKFEGVSSAAKLFVNGKGYEEHKGGYTPFKYDITKALKKGNNLIAVKVDSRERADIPPFGNQIDYLCYGGIYREVSIIVSENISIDNTMIVGSANKEINGKVNIYNAKKEKCNINLKIELSDGKKKIHTTIMPVSLSGEMYEEVEIREIKVQGNITLWDLENPKLYNVEVSLDNGEKIELKTGFRDAYFTAQGFFLNSKNIKLRGLNRHQSYPYVGYAMPKRVQEEDANILKYELGSNVVRSSHYPPSEHFLNRCDEIGLLVLEEVPGWQHIGDKEWQDNALKNIEEMIVRDYHHPSVILWGVRVNESPDNHDFYTNTNALARSMDYTRQTSGTRFITNSKLLEDVYTMNDFNYEGTQAPLREQKVVTGLKEYVPYMITEYNGHMFPTKSIDNEEHLMQHVLRHYTMLNALAGYEHVSGGTGWCAFDYHTHYDFGSGDRFCYHGVCDIFRSPKWAAACYASQMDTKEAIVLEPHTHWTRGNRPIGGILPLIISTNCDYIELYFGDKLFTKAYPDKKRFGALKHPPVYIEMPEGFRDNDAHMYWKYGKVVGYINGKKVAQKLFASNHTFEKLDVKVSDKKLNSIKDGSSWDSTKITVRAVDKFGSTLPYINTYIDIDVRGGGKLIGDKIAVLEAGVYSFWVATTKEKKSINITIKNNRVKDVNIKIDVV